MIKIIIFLLLWHTAAANPKPRGAVIMQQRGLIKVMHPQDIALKALRVMSNARTHKKQLGIKGRVIYMVV